MTLKPLSGDRVEIKATGTRDQIREAVGAPNSALDKISDLVEVLDLVRKHVPLPSGVGAVVDLAIKNAWVM
ncbi:hypothetical protein [Paraburkholderia tropica]|uniref:hypothetical protein n=1 Tax=Paraburkholderia tropica TaxID=92647 RepID=UPI00301A1DC6